MFRQWAKDLPDRIELVSLQLPGRGRRILDPPYEDWDFLVADASRSLALYRRGPHAFYGHSFGARLAYELIQRSGDANPPMRLFVSGSRGPSVPQQRPFMHPLPEPQFRAALRQLGGTPEEIFDDEPLISLLSASVRADIRLSELWDDRHAGRPITVPVTAMYGRDDSIDDKVAMAGWADHTCAGFELLEMPGGHFFLDTHRDELLTVLTARLGLSR
ncbi:thioesterase [Nocardia transvalensis]|nr:thioesterase [Nocardia transvalensis]